MIKFQEKAIRKQERIEESQLTKKQEIFQQYISQRVFKDKSLLCRIAIPYVLEDEQDGKAPKSVKQQLQMSKAQKKRTKFNFFTKSVKEFKPMFNYQKTPMNEYLNYDLSQQINVCLKQVKYLADQIKQIKQQKKKQIQKGQQKKQNKKIRIRRTNIRRDINPSPSTGCLR